MDLFETFRFIGDPVSVVKTRSSGRGSPLGRDLPQVLLQHAGEIGKKHDVTNARLRVEPHRLRRP
jgi:hypothetical protein